MIRFSSPIGCCSDSRSVTLVFCDANEEAHLDSGTCHLDLSQRVPPPFISPLPHSPGTSLCPPEMDTSEQKPPHVPSNEDKKHTLPKHFTLRLCTVTPAGVGKVGGYFGQLVVHKQGGHRGSCRAVSKTLEVFKTTETMDRWIVFTDIIDDTLTENLLHFFYMFKKHNLV